MLKWIAIGFLFFFVVIELTFLAPRRGDRDPVQGRVGPIDTSQQSDVEQLLSGTHLVESQGQKKMWELNADQARKKKSSPDWQLDQVDVKFYGENQVQYNCIGNQGFVSDNQKKLKVEGDVVITSNNGYVLKTAVVYYNTNKRMIEGPEPVKLKGEPANPSDGGPLYMESDYFDADLNTNVINLYKNVRGRKRLNDGRLMRIRSQEAEFSGQSNEAYFRKDVVMDMEAMTVTGPRARFVYKEGELHSLFMDGGVKIKDVGRWGVAGEAEVFFQEDKFVFRDNPKVVQGDDQLLGDVIIVYDKGDRIQVLKAKSKYRTKEEGEEGF
jgi:LPS export ABC transporter protein LptC